MTSKPLSLDALLDQLEAFYGVQQPCWPVDPYEFLIWWHCGYPASDTTCAKGWAALNKTIGSAPRRILDAAPGKLEAAMRAGGMVPELRAMRLKQIADRVEREFGGNLHAGLVGPVADVRKKLKRFPGIADPGADRIFLFGHLEPVAAVASNCPHVLVRIQLGLERESYSVTYREAQSMIEAEIPKHFYPRQRAYLLLKEHGQKLCKRSKPKCVECPISSHCSYFAGNDRGRSRPW